MREQRYKKRYQEYYIRFLEVGNEEEAEVAAMRLLCQRDLYFLASVIFKLKDAKGTGVFNRRKRWYEPIHGPMCDMFEKDEDTLVVVFRGAMKTTIAKVWMIQKIIQNPDVRIGFWSKGSALAEATLDGVKSLAQNEELVRLFPEILKPRKRGRKGGWEKDNATQMTIVRSESMRAVAANECQIEVWGTTSSVTGRHYDYMYYDDPIDKDNVSSPSMVEKMREWWGAVQAIKEPGAIQKYTGTPWHAMDLLSTVKKLFKKENTMEQTACTEDIAHINYPFFTKKFLEDQLEAMRPYLFSCQYRLDTRPRGDRIFVGHEEYSDEMFPEDPKYYISVDPSTGTGTDKTGVCVAAVSRAHPNQLFFVEAEGYMLRPNELCDLIIGKIRDYKPVRIGIEFGLQAALEPLLIVKLREQGIRCPDIKRIRTGGGEGTQDKKSVKIARSIGAFTRDGRALFKPDMYALFDQMELYNPNVIKNEDDILDAAGMMIQTVEHFAPGHWYQGKEEPSIIKLGTLPEEYFFRKKRKTLREKLLIA